MKNKHLTFWAVAALSICLGVLALRSADESKPGPFEYCTIRWAGRDNTHLIRPGGSTEIIGQHLRQIERPDRIDERAFYLSIAMNGLVKEGYEFAGMTGDTIIMKRHLGR